MCVCVSVVRWMCEWVEWMGEWVELMGVCVCECSEVDV